MVEETWTKYWLTDQTYWLTDQTYRSVNQYVSYLNGNRVSQGWPCGWTAACAMHPPRAWRCVAARDRLTPPSPLAVPARPHGRFCLAYNMKEPWNLYNSST